MDPPLRTKGEMLSMGEKNDMEGNVGEKDSKK